ncbi:FAD/NAD(P)-binding protein [Micromonospora terminaliae]|nr:FAD/NAD(P)-binding protein [Micromonospora terminaliae]NES30208.1 FAD/NAD(P)-binding protein [Micromonospora terminaliae]
MGEHYAPEQWRKCVTVAIVGLGVRGLGVLERLISHASLVDEKVTFNLHLVDPNPAQPHQYDIHQPDYLLLNHACAYVSMFPSVTSVAHAPATSGPNLFEWARERGMRVASDGFTVGGDGRQVMPNDNLPRRVFGEYLLWFHQYLRDNAPDNVRLVSHVSRAVDLQPKGDTSILYLDNGDRVEADYVFVTVGQLPSRARDDQDLSADVRIGTPYPLPGQLASVHPSETIAIAGLGLTATDAILALTVGRGGRFDRSVVPERYVPSGREPRIVVFSRSGLPYRARPAPSSVVSYEPVAFTRSAIDRLRAGTPQLDFDRDVLPLLLLEMRVAYRRAALLQEAGAGAAEVFLLRARAAAAAGRLHTLADLPGPAEFDAEAAYHGTLTPGAQDSPAPIDGEAYQRSVESWIAADLANAARGFEGSPFKAATEMCREVRDTIRYAIEFGGLTDASLDRFYRYHVETINRLVIGPEKERSANILTLLRSGVVSMSLGPNPLVTWDSGAAAWSLSSTAFPVRSTIRADWLYQGYTDRLRSLQDDTSVVGAMARRGVLRRFKPDSAVVSSIDVDGQGHPVAEDGSTASRIWIFGLLCEGATFYNGYLTSPQRFERAQFDVDHAVHELIKSVRREGQITSAFEGEACR